MPLWGFHLFYAASAASFTACAIIVKVVDLLCKQNDRLLSFDLNDIVLTIFSSVFCQFVLPSTNPLENLS